jgi:hypothetical protein
MNKNFEFSLKRRAALPNAAQKLALKRAAHLRDPVEGRTCNRGCFQTVTILSCALCGAARSGMDKRKSFSTRFPQ